MKQFFSSILLIIITQNGFSQIYIGGVDSLFNNHLNEVSINISMNSEIEGSDWSKNTIHINEVFTLHDITTTLSSNYGFIKEKIIDPNTTAFYFKYPTLKASYKITVTMNGNHVSCRVSQFNCEQGLDINYRRLFKKIEYQIYLNTHFFEWLVPQKEIEDLLESKLKNVTTFRFWSCGTDSAQIEECTFMSRNGSTCSKCHLGDTISEHDIQEFVDELRRPKALFQYEDLDCSFDPHDGVIGFDNEGKEILFIPICYNCEQLTFGGVGYGFSIRNQSNSSVWEKFNKKNNQNFESSLKTDLILLKYETNQTKHYIKNQ